MLYSRRRTLYDSSDQSEHRSSDPGDDPTPRNDPAPPPGPAARAEEPPDEQRWDNEGGEGGGPRDETASPSFVFAGDLTAKPAWSVLSLTELNEAIRRDAQAEAARAASPRVAPATAPARPEPAREGNAWEYAYEPPPPPDSSAAPGTHA